MGQLITGSILRSRKMKINISLLICFVFAFAISASAAEMIVNEYNCVGSAKYLDGETYSETGTNGVLEVDRYLATIDPANFDGRVQGNAGNWIELVIVEDHLDIRGWKLKWASAGNTNTNGTDYWYGDGGIEQGIITFSTTRTELSDLRAGTILTITEPNEIGVDTDDYGYSDKNFTGYLPEDEWRYDFFIQLNTDLSWDPYHQNPNDQDWWINISSIQESLLDPNTAYPLVTTVSNVNGDVPGNFSVGNDDWQIMITKADDTVVFGPIGEAVSGWGGSGLNSKEAARLEAIPDEAIIDGSEFDDGNDSSLGMPNIWGSPVEKVQNFGKIRSWLYPPKTCAEAIEMGYSLELDYSQNCIVDLDDLAIAIMDYWTDCIVPGDTSCSEPWNN